MSRIKNAKRIANEIADSTGLKLNRLQKLGILLDYTKETFLYGIRPVEYIQFDFYWKKARDRRRYVCKKEYDEIVEVSNDKAYYHFFDDKALFNITFSDYLGREWLDMTQCSLEEFEALTGKCTRLFIKPRDGWFGRGAYVAAVPEDAEVLYRELKGANVVVEEVVEQHEELAAFNPSSVNTLRVVTMLYPDQSVRVMAAILRMGRKGSVVDNFHFYGIAAAIEIESGRIMTLGMDRNFEKYVAHPDSGKEIIGFQIPNWEAVIERVSQAARVVPEIRYVGWDVAIGRDGRVIIIEGNKSAEPDAEQITERVGHWPLYKEVLDLYRKEGTDRSKL